MQKTLGKDLILLSLVSVFYNLGINKGMTLRTLSMVFFGIFLTGCATMSENSQPDVQDHLLYDGASPVTFENVFSAEKGVDYVALGDAELAKGELDKALFAYLKALQNSKDKAAVYFKIGSIHSRRDNSRLAEIAFKKVVESDPEHVEALQALGLLNLKARNYSKSKNYFESAIDIDKKRFSGLEENQAIPTTSNEEIMLIKSDIALLRQELRETLEYRSELYGQIDSLKKGEDYQSSYDPEIADLNEQLRTLSDDFTEDHPDVLLIKSQLTQLEAKRDQELSQPQSAVEQEKASEIRAQLTQTNDKAKEIGSSLRAKQQEFSNAQTVTMQKTAVKPYDRSSPVWAYNGLGILADLNSRYAEAIEYYQTANQIQPRSAQINNNLGYSNYLADNWAIAEAYFRRALNYNPNYKRTWRNLGLLYTRMGHYEDALLTLSRVMEKAEAYNSMGYVCMLQGKHDDADKFFDQSIELSPSYYELAYENKEKNTLLRSRSLAQQIKDDGLSTQ